MLKNSLAAHRVYEMLNDYDYKDNSEGFQYYGNIAFAVWDLIEQKFIPKDKQKEFDRLMFEYDLANESQMMVFAQEVYYQGIQDGIELSKKLK